MRDYMIEPTQYDTILRTAMEQSAVDLSCEPEDFCSAGNKVVISRKNENARQYLELPFFFQIVSYGNNVLASVSEDFAPFAEKYINQYGAVRSFETPAILALNDKLMKYGHKVCFMARYYLPVPELIKPLPLDCDFALRVMEKPEFEEYYLPEFGNAICAEHSEKDVLAVGAFDGSTLVGLAGASADCESMWQIGVDVLPEYRRRGIASAVTSRLALEIMHVGKVPFYCAAWSNVRSARNAVKSGFRPAWVELTAKSSDFVNKMNGSK